MTKKYVRKIIIIGTDLQKIGKTRGVFWMKCVNAFIQRIETTDVDSEERWGGKGLNFSWLSAFAMKRASKRRIRLSVLMYNYCVSRCKNIQNKNS